MSGKVKMRCARCGKPFKSSGARQTLCTACETAVRNERAASKTAAPKTTGPVQAQAQAPKIVGPGASILVPGLVSTEVSAPPESGPFGRRPFERGGAGTAAETRERPSQGPRPAHGGHPSHGPATSSGAHRTPQGTHGTHGTQATHEKPQQRPARQDGQQKPPLPRTPKEPKEPKQPRPPTPPMELSTEMREKIEQRYLELADPVEFDGIRTQIAGEMGVPKALVKRAVQDLRGRMQLPSWWELQSYTGGNMDLERIRRAYVPLLPVPEVGIHKQIAGDLGLEPGDVYQAIKRIRAEMRLPRYNPPALHEGAKPASAGTDEGQQPALDGQPAAGSSDEVPVSAQGSEAR